MTPGERSRLLGAIKEADLTPVDGDIPDPNPESAERISRSEKPLNVIPGYDEAEEEMKDEFSRVASAFLRRIGRKRI